MGSYSQCYNEQLFVKGTAAVPHCIYLYSYDDITLD